MYRLLIVEDDHGIAEAIKEQTKMWELDAHIVDNFRKVLNDFRSLQPHIGLLDIALPFFNGYHWCSEIRKISKVPIIFISSTSDNMNIVMAMNMGADDFIAKPFDMEVQNVPYTYHRRRYRHRGGDKQTGAGVGVRRPRGAQFS